MLAVEATFYPKGEFPLVTGHCRDSLSRLHQNSSVELFQPRPNEQIFLNMHISLRHSAVLRLGSYSGLKSLHNRKTGSRRAGSPVALRCWRILQSCSVLLKTHYLSVELIQSHENFQLTFTSQRFIAEIKVRGEGEFVPDDNYLSNTYKKQSLRKHTKELAKRPWRALTRVIPTKRLL